MPNIYREELSRALVNKRFLLVFLLAGISFLYGFFQMKTIVVEPLDAITIWQGILQRGYYGFFACVMAVLPFADSLSVDKNERVINHFLLRVEYKKYIAAKFLSAIVSGAVAVLLPAILMLLICALMYPANPVQIPTLSFSVKEILPGQVISPGTALKLTPLGYLALCWLFLAFFGMAYAMLAMGLSFHTKNSLIVLGFPFLCYSFGYYFIPSSRHLHWLISSEAALIPQGNLISAVVQWVGFGLFFCANVLLFGNKERQVIK